MRFNSKRLAALGLAGALCVSGCGGEKQTDNSQPTVVAGQETQNTPETTETPAVTETPTVEVTPEAVPTEPVAVPPVPSSTPTPEVTEEPVATLAPGSGEQTEEFLYQEMLKRSLMSTGNNERIKKAIEKARRGEDVVIAYIGGSITEGANTTDAMCYVTKSYEGFCKVVGTEDTSNIHLVNAGMSGTPSALGVIRYERDVIDRFNQKPDIVFIEFSVNDYQEPTDGVAYESMIREIYGAENDPAVVLLFAVFKSRWNMQSNYIPLGNVYKLPMVSILDAVVPALDEEKWLTDEAFFSDEYHPTTYGHMIMADCITYMFETIDAMAADEPFALPKGCYNGNAYEGTQLIDTRITDADVEIEAGGFCEVDDKLGGFRYDSTRKTFPDNWMHTAESGSDSFKMKIECQSILLIYKSSNSASFGKAEIYVDDKLAATIDGYNAGGWNNPMVAQICRGKSVKEHTIEIRMAEGNEDKCFSILGFGCGKRK